MPNPKLCQSVQERKQLTEKIWEAFDDPHESDGSEFQMLRAFDILQGIVAEYTEGGDQVVENCSCGKHTELDPRAFDEVIRDYRATRYPCP